VRLLKSSQGPLRGRPHFTVRRARIVAAAFQFALQAFNEVRGWGPGTLWMRLGLRACTGERHLRAPLALPEPTRAR
jgi:hypothetical protein